MNTAALLVVALLLDAALGEPRWLWSRAPHPAVLMGRAVSWCETRLNHGKLRLLKGALAMGVLAFCAYVLGELLSLLGPLAEILIAAMLLAQRSLVQHVGAVADGLRQSLPQGRRAVSMIVSRDTSAMDAPAAARSAIESAAENFSDGVIAPAFWFLLGGLPLLLVYKITNTADSMIGYRTPRYELFGKAAARLDDLLNWIPARLSAALIALPGGVAGQWRAIASDAKLHRSPNAGWPESAMARALHVALAGPRSYDGQQQHFPWVHGAGARTIGPVQIDAAINRLWRAWAAALCCALLLALL
ncbi:MAG: adenosylcobinamide-phosphate synthase CbiB [Sulfitobacter sp.]